MDAIYNDSSLRSHLGSDDRNIPAVAIEYKAPHKLRRGEIVTGLVAEIQPDRDVINQEGEGYVFAARQLTTAVVTQLFSYMIGEGIHESSTAMRSHAMCSTIKVLGGV